MNLTEYQQKVHEYINQFEEGYWKPLAMLAALMEEVGESAKIINAIEGIKPLKNKNSGDLKNLLSEELGDVFFALCCIANHFGIQLDSSLNSSINKFNNRDSTRWKKSIN